MYEHRFATTDELEAFLLECNTLGTDSHMLFIPEADRRYGIGGLTRHEFGVRFTIRHNANLSLRPITFLYEHTSAVSRSASIELYPVRVGAGDVLGDPCYTVVYSTQPNGAGLTLEVLYEKNNPVMTELLGLGSRSIVTLPSI